MKNTKQGVSLQLKVLYGILFALSLTIIIVFYFDKSSSTQATYQDFLEKQLELISSQIDKGSLAEIINNEFPIPDPQIEGLPEYSSLKHKIQTDNEILDINQSEIRILVQLHDNSLINLVCSDELYKYGENYRDRTNLINRDLAQTIISHQKINQDLTKTYIISPIKNSNNETLAFLSLAAPKNPFMAVINERLIRNLVVLSAIYFLLGMFFMKNLRKNRMSFANQLLESQTISEKLEAQNKDLEMLSLIAQTSKDLILITDNKGIILWINDSYKTKNNYSKNELESFIGTSLHKVSRNKNIGNIIKNANSFKEEFTYETRSLDNDGNEFWAETLVNPVIVDNEVTKVIFIDSNITELMNLKTKMELKEITSNKNSSVHE